MGDWNSRRREVRGYPFNGLIVITWIILAMTAIGLFIGWWNA